MAALCLAADPSIFQTLTVPLRFPYNSLIPAAASFECDEDFSSVSVVGKKKNLNSRPSRSFETIDFGAGQASSSREFPSGRLDFSGVLNWRVIFRPHLFQLKPSPASFFFYTRASLKRGKLMPVLCLPADPSSKPSWKKKGTFSEKMKITKPRALHTKLPPGCFNLS